MVAAEGQDNEKNSQGNNTVEKDRIRFLKDIIKFAYQTGARQGEILKMKRDHIDWDNKLCTFYDTKNSADRTIPLADETINILKKYRFGSAIFDCNDRRLRKWFNKATKESKNIRLSFSRFESLLLY